MGDVLGGDTQMQLSRCVYSNLCVYVCSCLGDNETDTVKKAAVCFYVLPGKCVTIRGTLASSIVKV